ncbi:MAG: efflux RND transporter periplasmic adaptor subunit [Bacteroidales bacterium]|jgi:RND family efflux transporter MFP subunit|nr:efflux RND transporter periplasmic adaptor subunit [Bacteroidales bacterium]
MNNNQIICCILFAALFCSCGKNGKNSDTIIRTAKIDTVRLSGRVQESVYPGKIKANAEASLSFRIAGSILKIPHNEGVFVRKGTAIAILDSRDYVIQLSATEAEYGQIKATTERVVELYNRGSATKDEYDRAVSGLKQISAKYDYQKNQVADTRLLAPFDGYIKERIHQEGETVGAGMPVIAMIGKGDWQLEINLPVNDYTRRNDFARFEAIVSAEKAATLPLELIEFSPQGNANQLYSATFRIKQTDGVTLAAGMSAEVRVIYKTTEEAVCKIPVSAMFERDGKPHVWIYTSADKPLESRKIKVKEMQYSGDLVVTEGLKDGELILVAGVHSIKEGMKVKPLPPVSVTNVGGLL